LPDAGLFEIGIGHLVVGRTLPSGLLGCGFFLVDPFCLGVKEVIYAELPREELHTRLPSVIARRDRAVPTP